MAYGFVYILGNASMPGIYKIGQTGRHPKERVEDLSRATACPTPFVLLAYFGCHDHELVEREIHDDLSGYRVSAAREFFRVSAATLLQCIRSYCNTFEDALFIDGFDTEVFVEEHLLAQEWKRQYFFEQSADLIYWGAPNA